MLRRPSDSLREWMGFYQRMAVADIRSEQVAHKIHLHLKRFQAFFEE